MKRAWTFVFGMGIALSGCEKPCTEGFQRYGAECVRSPVKDAGTDTDAIGSGDGHEQDAGRTDVAEVDAGSTAPALDAGKEPDPLPDAGPYCYLDRDGDGVGAGSPVPCPVGQSSGDALVNKNGDCDDNDPTRSPALTDLCGDAIDNDCDGKVDEESNNACGGPCNVQLGHQPGESCSNELLGECTRAGKYICDGGTATKCDAPTPTASAELCGDGKDNDCDGSKDEADAIDATSWYQDCDGDGYAASTTGMLRACSKPANLGACGWTSIVPDPTTKSNWDCNDSLTAYAPNVNYGLPPPGSTSYDLNCDGQAIADPEWPKRNRVCGQTVIDRLNAGLKDCDTTSGKIWSGCFYWTGGDGKYTNNPGCAPAAIHQLTEVLDPWSLNGPIMRFAHTCATRTVRGRGTGSASRESGSPLQIICGSARTDKVWGCR